MDQSLLIVVLGLLLAVLFGYKAVKVCEAANEADWGGRWWNHLDGLNRIFCRHYHRFRYEPIPLPESGGAIVVSNHVSGLDPLLLTVASRRPLRFMIAREQYERFGFTWLFRSIGCIPVERDTRPEHALREALRALQSGEVVVLFPHGRIHLDGDPPRPLKRGFAKLSELTGARVFPVRLEGIRGERRLVSAVFVRSRARLAAFPPVDCADMEATDCLAEVAACIEGRR